MYTYLMSPRLFLSLESAYPIMMKSYERAVANLEVARDVVAVMVELDKIPSPRQLAAVFKAQKVLAVEEANLDLWAADGLENKKRKMDVIRYLNRTAGLRELITDIQFV